MSPATGLLKTRESPQRVRGSARRENGICCPVTMSFCLFSGRQTIHAAILIPCGLPDAYVRQSAIRELATV
jgi:hypothetical protein